MYYISDNYIVVSVKDIETIVTKNELQIPPEWYMRVACEKQDVLHQIDKIVLGEICLNPTPIKKQPLLHEYAW
jgi:hypothetical protein